MTETALETGQLPPASRRLAKVVMEGHDFRTAEAMSLVPPGGGGVIRSTRDELQLSLRSLRDVEPQLNGTYAQPVKESLAVIGMKVRPEMQAGEAQEWMKAMLIALSDLPPHCIRKAAAEAIHTPFRFLNEVEVEVRRLAEMQVGRIRTGIRRLEAMMAEIIRAFDPPAPQVEDRTAVEPMTRQELRALSPEFRRIGLAKGWITQEQLDEADAE